MLILHSTERLRCCQAEFAQLDTPEPAQRPNCGPPRYGFGRAEVLLVAVCVVILAALVSTGIYQRRLSARENLCGARQFRVALAVQGFANEFQQLPGYRELQAIDAADQPAACSWVFPILPFIEPLDQPLQIQRGDQVRQIPGAELPQLADEERILFAKSSFQEIVDRYGPGGAAGTRGRQPQRRIVELICPADPASDTQVNYFSWRVNVGLPDQTDPKWPADWPENGVFLDHFLPPGPTSELTLSEIEARDGLSYTVLFSEGLQPQVWTDSQESAIGVYWAQPGPLLAAADDGPPAPVDPESWKLLGVDSQLGGSDAKLARPSSLHPKGISVALCSGATTVIAREIDPVVWAQMMMSHDAAARFPGTEIRIPAALGGRSPTAVDSLTP